MKRRTEHPFSTRWNHNSHYFPHLRAAIPTSSRRVLDIGCGDGTFCRFITTDSRAVTGVDVDTSVLPRPSGQVSYLAGSAESLGLADDTFDAVTMTMVLHHVDATRALREAARVLAPGGALLILGMARYGGWRDGRHEVRDLVAHRLLSRGKTPWEPPTAKAAPGLTWSQTEAALRHELPGCSYKRLPLWRYLSRWHKPMESQ